jgi:hypothetical protein
VGTRASNQDAAAYAAVASEYYDVALHPTCAAFNSASFKLLQDYFFGRALGGAVICDIGAGKSQVARLLGSRLTQLDSFWLVDASQEMLSWSDKLNDPNIRRRIEAAENIHLLDIRFDFIVASLGDPYNCGAFWHSVERSLRTDGVCLFTTPSYEWASSFRRADRNEVTDKALFVLADGSRHYVPSYIYSPSKQCELLRVNSLEIFSIRNATIECLGSVPPKLSHLDTRTPVVTLYEISRSGS